MMKSTTQASLIAEYKRLLGDSVRGNHSIYASEMFLFWKEASKHNPKRILESGTYLGSSAKRLRLLFPDVEIITFEISKGHFKQAEKVDGVDYRRGELKNNLKLITDSTVVLIDGPKRKLATRLARQCLREGALCVGMHDMYEYVDYLKKKFKSVVHSGNPSATVKRLDDGQVVKSPSKKYYGTTLAVVR